MCACLLEQKGGGGGGGGAEQQVLEFLAQFSLGFKGVE